MSGQGEEQETTLGSIDAALGALVHIAEATDLVKAFGGVSIDQGGHTDERGATSGGYADAGDMGSLDSMMIGKMQEALIDAGFDAGAIAAFMRGKKKDDEEGEGEGDGDAPPFGKMGHVGHQRPSPSGGARKSHDDGADAFQKALNSLRESEHIAEAVDISPFMEDFVEKSAMLHADLVKSLREGQAATDEKFKHVAAATFALGTMLKSIVPVVEALNSRLSLVEKTPMPARGATTLTGAQALAKSLPREVGAGGLGGGGGQAPMQLAKSQMVSTLSYMNLEKGITQIGGIPTTEMVSMLEAGNQLHPLAAQAVQRFIQSHPNEAETALRYR